MTDEGDKFRNDTGNMVKLHFVVIQITKTRVMSFPSVICNFVCFYKLNNLLMYTNNLIN